MSNKPFTFDQAKAAFWAKVQKGDGCWIWKGATCPPSGYGRFLLRGKLIAAHRAAWIFTNGEIPEGMDLLHSCDNPPCVNPSHLRLGTHADNMYDMYMKGRRRLKLTADQAREIKRRFVPGDGANTAAIAAEFNIVPATVWNIAKGKLWKHL